MESYQQMSCHQGGYNLDENRRQEMWGKGHNRGNEWGPHLKKGGLCGVQLSVALNLQEQTQNIY